jgi:hypothetical protein
MESHFGHDFSQVRVHADANAAESARAVGASAYTVGRDIVFDEGRFAPRTQVGQKLLAHELAHVVQQSRAEARADVIGDANDAFESAADRAAHALGTDQAFAIETGGAPPALQRKTPEELAAKSIESGPATDKKQFGAAKKVEAKAAKAKTPSTRVTIATPHTSNGVKTVTTSEFNSQWKACPTAHAEAGLPSAFLCAVEEITPPQVATDATLTTNVNVTLDGTDKKGTAYVAQVDLPWTLTTAGFLNIDIVDPKMLAPYEAHERGHRTIAVDIRNRLAKMLQADLDAALPTKAKPAAYSGPTWGQDAVDAIVKKIDTLTQRYKTWYDELAGRADAAWDSQEAKSLSAIANAVKQQQGRQPVAPKLKEDEE